jgi:tetratricopeptide (TPR) repeat protein
MLKIIISLILAVNTLVTGLGFGISVSRAFAAESSKEEEALYVAKKAFDDGFYDVTLSMLERFLGNYPVSDKTVEVNLLVGRCYFYQNRFLDALNKFQDLLAFPGIENIKDEIYYWIAEVHFRGNNFARAGEYYKKVIDGYPKSSYLAAAYYSCAWSYFQERKFSQALEYFTIVEQKFSDKPFVSDASFKIVECLYNLKDYPGLKSSIKTYLLKFANENAKLLYLNFYLGEAEFYLNNFEDAIDAYNKVIALKGDEKIAALSRLGIGWAFIKLERYPQGLDALANIKKENLDKRSLDVLLLGEAIIAFETEKFSQSKDTYEELLNSTQDPLVRVQAYLGKGDSLYNLNNYKEAINLYKAALSSPDLKNSDNQITDKLHYGLAWAYLKEGAFKEGIKEFQSIVASTQDNIVKISALCQIGDAYQESADYAKAIETYDNILKNYSDNFYSDYVQYQLGLALLKSLNYDGAIASFLVLKKNYPNSKLLDDASYSLGLAYFQNQDYNSSKEIFEKFRSEFKDSHLQSQGLYLLGASFFNLGKYQDAIEVFKDIIRIYGQDSEIVQKAEYEIADCYYQMGDEKEAMSRFKALRVKYPDSKLTSEIMWWLGEYYYRHNDLNLARRYFTSLIQDYPNSNLVVDAYYALGSIDNEEGRYPQAITNFSKVIKLGGPDLAGQAAIALADVCVKEDKIDEAINNYLELTKNFPNLISLIYPKLADTYLIKSDYAKALEFYQKSLEVVPFAEMANIQFKLAEVLQAQGKAQEAIQEYLKVTYLYPKSQNLAVKSLLRIGKAYEDKENFKEAINIYQKIIDMKALESKYAQERTDILKTQQSK